MRKTCIVLGASSQVGSWLVPRLIQAGQTASLVSRGIKPQTDYGTAATWLKRDLKDDLAAALPEHAGAPLAFDMIGIRPTRLDGLHRIGVRRIVTFSSTSMLTKAGSHDPVDVRMIREVTERERCFVDECERLHIDWTILRPTLIYGGKFGDRTVDDIAGVIRRFRFFPAFGKANGLRQPVHADDLARACALIGSNRATFNRSYNVAGGETISYREMVERVFAAMGLRPRIARIPLPAFEVAASILRLHPRYRHIRSSMAERMEKDMTFDSAEAVSDFGYAARRFEPLAH